MSSVGKGCEGVGGGLLGVFRLVHELGTLVEEGREEAVGRVLSIWGFKKYERVCWVAWRGVEGIGCFFFLVVCFGFWLVGVGRESIVSSRSMAWEGWGRTREFFRRERL